MKTKIGHHFSYNRELYVYLPLFIALCVGAILGVNWLTGRQVSDDPAAVVGFLYNALGLVVTLILTGLTQKHLFGFRSEHHGDASTLPRLTDDIYDACVSFALLSLFAHYLWH